MSAGQRDGVTWTWRPSGKTDGACCFWEECILNWLGGVDSRFHYFTIVHGRSDANLFMDNLLAFARII